MSEVDLENLEILETPVSDETFGDADYFIIYSSQGTPCYKITRESARAGRVKHKAKRFHELNREIDRLTKERDEIHAEYGDEILQAYFDAFSSAFEGLSEEQIKAITERPSMSR